MVQQHIRYPTLEVSEFCDGFKNRIVEFPGNRRRATLLGFGIWASRSCSST
jgi:hypothetical protein